MILEVGLIAAGIPVGWALRKSATAQTVVSHTLTWTVRLLLLLLGIALGADQELISQLDSLGLRAAAVSLSALAGSLLCARIFGRFLRLEDRA